MKAFNEARREKQIEFLDRMDSKEVLGRHSEYSIVAENGKNTSCKCAGTAIMLLSTEYKNVNVYIKKVA